MKKPDLRKRDDIETRNTLDKVNTRENKRPQQSRINEIIRHDLKASFSNPIVIMIIIAMLILPSLYALVNIYACWDPYENTGNVQFAIANEDKGASYENYTVNVGNELVESLKNNTDFKWTYVTGDELRNGVYEGKYYAGIYIPENFSESVVSITTDNPHSAELEYYVNEKSNPVAAKLADSASRSIYNNINAKIVSFINVAAYGKLGELQEGLSSGADEMSDGAEKLSAGADEVASGANQLTEGAEEVSSGALTLSNGATELSRGANKLSTGADTLSSGAHNLSDGTQQLANKANEIYTIYLKIKKTIKDSEPKADQLRTDVNKLDSEYGAMANNVKELENQSNRVNNQAVDVSNQANALSNDANQLIADSNRISSNTHNISNRVDEVSKYITELNHEMSKPDVNWTKINQILNMVDAKMAEVNSNVTKLNYGAHAVESGTVNVSKGARQLAGGSDQLAGGARKLSDGVQVLSDGTIKLADGAELLGYTSASALQNASDEIGGAADQLAKITGLNESQVGDYFFAPVVLNRHEDFSTSNYGSQVASFYIVLSMWVGGLINTVLLRTSSVKNRSYKPQEVYLGKLLIFNLITFLQTTVTIIGSLLLGIDIVNPIMFILSCYFVSMVFMTVIYSFVSVFGDIGKGISILLLVFQISGSGGVYPIEIMNDMFHIIYPYLPMTHGITMVREAQLGLIWNNYLPAFAFLLIFGAAVMLISLLLKRRWDKRTKFLEEKLEESELFN